MASTGTTVPNGSHSQTVPSELRTKLVQILSNTANGCLAELGYDPREVHALREQSKRWQIENVKLYEDNTRLSESFNAVKEQLNQLQNPSSNTTATLYAQLSSLREENDFLKRQLAALELQQPGQITYNSLYEEYQKLVKNHESVAASLRSLYAHCQQCPAFLQQTFQNPARHAQQQSLSVPGQYSPTQPPGQPSWRPSAPITRPPSQPGTPPVEINGSGNPSVYPAYRSGVQGSGQPRTGVVGGPPQPAQPHIVPSHSHVHSTTTATQQHRNHSVPSVLGPNHHGVPNPPQPSATTNVAPNLPNFGMNHIRGGVQTNSPSSSLPNTPLIPWHPRSSLSGAMGPMISFAPRASPSNHSQAPSPHPTQSTNIPHQSTGTDPIWSPHNNEPTPPPLHQHSASPIPILNSSLSRGPTPSGSQDASDNERTTDQKSQPPESPMNFESVKRPLDGIPSDVDGQGKRQRMSVDLSNVTAEDPRFVSREQIRSNDDASFSNAVEQSLLDQVNADGDGHPMQAVDGGGAVEEEHDDDDEDDDEEEIRIGPDGLRLVSDCLADLFSTEDRGKICVLCHTRYTSGYIPEPKPFVDASEDDLVAHCVDEHGEVWTELRTG